MYSDNTSNTTTLCYKITQVVKTKTYRFVMTRFKNMNRSGEQLLERSEIIELFNGFGDVQSVYQDKKKWSYVRQVIAKSFAKISAAHLEYHKKSTPSLMLSNTFFLYILLLTFFI